MNILFVCTGNTCRSPMAEGLMNKIAEERGQNIHAGSAGIFADEGAGASREAVEACAEYGADISRHRARRLTLELADESDIILTMTAAHKQALVGIDNVYTLGEYSGCGDIADPYGRGADEYRAACAQIYDALAVIAEKLTDDGDVQ